MKNQMKKPLIIFFVIIGIIAIASTGIYLSVQQSAISDGLPDSKYIEKPTFGFLKCEAQQTRSIERTFGAEDVYISCSSDDDGTLLGMNDGCTVILQAPDDGFKVASRTYLYEIKRAGDTQFSGSMAISGGIGGYEGEEVSVTLSRGDVMHIAYGSSNGIFPDKLLSEGQRYKVTGYSFGLSVYDENSPNNGQMIGRLGNCVLENSYYLNREIEYHDNSIEELKDTPDAELNYANLNKPNGVYTYFADAEPTPRFDAKIETYNGKTVYCMNRNLYETLKIKVNGFNYEIVNYDASGSVATVTCCNDEETTTKICVNHEFVNKEDYECNIKEAKFCPQSTYQSYGDSSYKRYKCVDNECVADIVEVECNSNDDCKSGEVCGFHPSDPTKNKCVESGSGSGDVPSVNVEKEETNWTLIIIIGVVLLVLIVLMSKGKEEGKRTK